MRACKNLVYPLVFTELEFCNLRNLRQHFEKRATGFHMQKVDFSEAIKYTTGP